MSDINLLKKNTGGSKEVKILKILRTTSIISLFIVCVSSISLFIINSTQPVNDLKKEEVSLTAELSSYKQKMGKFMLINNRIKNISDIISHRSNFEKTIDLVSKQAPQEVQINNYSIDSKKINLSAASTSVLATNTFFDNLVKLVKDKNKLKRVTLNNLSVDGKSGDYSFSLNIELL